VTVAILLLASSSKLTLRSPELWVYLLGLSILLVIALRRVLAQQNPLKDEVYMTTVAIEHVQTGVAWVRADGKIRSINASLAATLGGEPKKIVGCEWHDLFAQQDRGKIHDAYTQMLILGKATVDVHGHRLDGSYSRLEVLMVAIHDHKMRFVGHHCLVLDRTREKVLEAQLEELAKNLDPGRLPISGQRTSATR
jgi:PAS domain S-box-containing protein